MTDLTKGSPTKQMLKFAMPVCLGNLFQLFYSLSDTRIVGSTLGEHALAAVGASTSISTLLIGFLTGLTNGFAILVAQDFGARNFEKIKKNSSWNSSIRIGYSYFNKFYQCNIFNSNFKNLECFRGIVRAILWIY